MGCNGRNFKELPPNSYIVLPPLADQKRCKSGGLICLLPLHSYTILPPLEAQRSPKRRKSFELHFPKNSTSHCCIFLPLQPHSYIILGGKIQPGNLRVSVRGSDSSNLDIFEQNSVTSFCLAGH